VTIGSSHESSDIKRLRQALDRRKKAGRAAFGTLRMLPSGRLQVRYVGPDEQRHTAPRTYDNIGDAETYLRKVQSQIDAGTWESADAKRAREEAALRDQLTLRPYADAWLAGRNLTGRTKSHYRSLLNEHILPTFGDAEVRAITPTTVRAWHATLLVDKPTIRAHAYSLLRAICTTAVSEEVLDANPCRVRGAGNAKRVHDPVVLTLTELETLVSAMPERHRLLVLLASWCAMRWGELTELRRGDIVIGREDDTLTYGTIRVRRAVTRVFTDGTGEYLIGRPKSDAGIRDIAIPPHLLTFVEAHLRDFTDTMSDALLFPAANGGHLAPSTFYGKAPKASLNRRTGKKTTRVGHGFYAARIAAGRPTLREHDLRHTGAVMAAQTGATLAELMGRLGHSTPGAALRYQHAAAGRDAEVARRMSLLAKADSASG
jgi:integrase